MLKRVCDFCGEEMSLCSPERDSRTQFYTLVKNIGEPNQTEVDICNACLRKITFFPERTINNE